MPSFPRCRLRVSAAAPVAKTRLGANLNQGLARLGTPQAAGAAGDAGQR